MTEILDAVTLERITTLDYPLDELRGTQRLAFSRDARLLTWCGNHPWRFVTWDLRTGSLVSTIALERPKHSRGHLSVTYSACGTMFAALFCGNSAFTISTYNVLLGTHTCSHSAEGWTLEEIWTHGEFLRFATVESRSITTWEAGFGSGHTPTRVESLSIPDNFHSSRKFRFHPTSPRLAFATGGSVFVWGARDSKFLLESTNVEGHEYMSMTFSFDGRFFACGMGNLGIHIWKVSPTGYTLHQKLTSDAGAFKPLVSPNGESIIASAGLAILLWRTTDFITSLSDISTLPFRRSGTGFVLGHSPDETLAAVTRMEDEMVVVVDLNSGIARLTIDTGMKVYAVGMTGSAIVVVGEGKIVTWNLPGGKCVLNPRVDVNDSVLATAFNCPSFPAGALRPISVSPNLCRIAMIGWCEDGNGEDDDNDYYNSLYLYDVATGQRLASHRPEAN
ncbi:YVTN repeat-like/Quino protein amine dehydrogenase [Thelephora ganbajun]|uniref:YVTN repeat-like/Quino protein amine dehydrogenase n=1 Tax=Thelephora ganbajun TaxID=370292 RepID=A0ACB6Z349_THEGA|nr:YVTN repeat-like/Quino protein amine dehydrogenase [Thelephora ganbajun]